MQLFVVSDLHIRDSDDPLYLSLLSILQEKAAAGDTVVLAGDLFDLFVGNKSIFTSRYRKFIEALESASARRVKVHYIEGNHDFLIRKAFGHIEGLKIHSHDVKLEISGRKFFVAHGDTVDREDYKYRVLRVFFRSPVMKALVKLAPGELLDQIGKKSSDTSRKGKPLLTSQLPIDKMESLRKKYRSYAAEKLTEGFDFVVMGHCHDLDQMKFKIGDRTGQYINVGYPRTHGSFLTWSPGDSEIQREPLP